MLFLITSFLNQQDYEITKSPSGQRQSAYNKILRELAVNGPDNLLLIEGHELMPLIDLIHPSASGHIQIASKLADKLTCCLKYKI